MYEAITGNFSTLAKLIVTDGSTLMIAGDLNILHFSAIALILVFLTVRITKKKYGSFFKPFMARSDPMSELCRATTPLSANLRCMRLQFSFWDGRTRAKIVTFTQTDDSRKVGSNFRVRGRDEITDKSEACRSIELLFSTRSHFSTRSCRKHNTISS
jgi:hypothetical protein